MRSYLIQQNFTDEQLSRVGKSKRVYENPVELRRFGVSPRRPALEHRDEDMKRTADLVVFGHMRNELEVEIWLNI